jgi:hypothetical protein
VMDLYPNFPRRPPRQSDQRRCARPILFGKTSKSKENAMTCLGLTRVNATTQSGGSACHSSGSTARIRRSF